MASSTLTIPEETMRTLIGEAILKGIDQNARDTLIQSAINHLIAPGKVRGQYGREEVGPSPIEEAFKLAVDAAARKYVHEWMASSDEAQAALKSQLDQLFSSYKTKLDDSWEFKTALNEWVIEYLTKKADERY